jgi:hypothetical protein
LFADAVAVFRATTRYSSRVSIGVNLGVRRERSYVREQGSGWV